ncbi:hypothetical protein [Helicobacter pylori]|uniref:hypothetical protein n=1 Tax=Helicobacter pylori TaxID=210 RepID=UPI0002B9CAB8|nr:hypothetical protein [Helicobacter pylori]MDO7821604.1 hypothetical protein [Helicobacter pylori]MDO7822969.1 hypothetical protein [Helicobacter pylori]OOC28840.1 hypothetical protein BZK23_00670 [Helicobacter pylori]
MISNISIHPKTYPPKLNATFLNPTNFFIKLIIIDELETSLEQKRSYIKSHKLAQHPTTYKHHRHSDPIVLDSYEWVGMATLINTKILLTLALIASRLIVVIAFIFIVLSSYAL